MNDNTAEPLSKARRVTVMAVCLFLSVVVPVAILVWLIKSNWSNKQNGRRSKEISIYIWGSVRDGELWYPRFRMGFNYAVPWDCQIVRLNLATGVQTETELQRSCGRARPLWVNDELYLIDETNVYKAQENSFVLVAPLPRYLKSFTIQPFPYDGKLTTVAEVIDPATTMPRDRMFQLIHLVDGKWVDDRKILLPGTGRDWYEDIERGRWSLAPLTSSSGLRSAGIDLSVAQHQGNVHLFFHCNTFGPMQPLSAYRNGFEFVDEASEAVSAMAPENGEPDVSGWEPVGGIKNEKSWELTGVDSDGMIFGGHQQFVRRTADGKWENVVGGESVPWEVPPHLIGIIADRQQGTAYLVDHEYFWNSAAFRRIQGNTIEPPHITLPPVGADDYIGRVERLSLGVLGAWLVHLVLVAAGTPRFLPIHSPPFYEFGRQQVNLASFRQRALAAMVDFVLMASIVVAYLFVHAHFLGMQWRPLSRMEICNSFMQIEFDVVVNWPSLPGNLPLHLMNLLRLVLFGHTQFPSWQSFFPVVCAALALSIAKVYVEGRTGITLGKWLFGLRTVRCTLRPCGFSRALVRDLLYWFDLPLMLSPIPACLCMTLSQNSQRLGDLAADTLVIQTATPTLSRAAD